MGGDQNSERKKTADFDRSLYGLCQLEQFAQYTPSGGTGVRVGGGRRPRRGDVRRGGPTAVEHAEGGGTTFCHRSCSRCSLSRVTWATRCDQSHAGSTPLDRHRALAKLRIGIIALHLNHATTPGLSVLAAVSWDTLKFAVQNRTHLFRSGQVDGSTGRTDLDGMVEHPHRETKYRPGPNPHWPVCHRIGPRFIHTCHFISSSGHFIYFHIRWDFILCFTHRTIVSATDQGG